MHIHALTIDRGGCFYYRVKQPLTYLRDRGHWTSWGSGIDFETWQRADVLVNQLLHNPATTQDWLRWCEGADKLCVWEADDDITAVHRSPYHGNAYDDPDTLPRMIRMIEASHMVTVSTDALADVYSRYNSNIVVLPNAVPDWLVDRPTIRSTEWPLILGYTGSASHTDDFAEWSVTLEKWMRHNSDKTLLHYWGLSRRPDGMPLTWRTKVYPWKKLTEHYLRILRMDVGIAPLEHTQFNLGKSPIKAMEYAALGIPAVVTDHPVYANTVVHGETGFRCRTTSEWLTALAHLWTEPELRWQMGENARTLARSQFLASDAAGWWERAYRRGLEDLRGRDRDQDGRTGW